MRQKGFFMSLLPYIRNEIPGLREALDAYTFTEILLDVDRYGKGHINDTFCAVCQSQEGNTIRFIIQRLSNAAFPNPEELMENFVGITSFLRNKILADGGDPTRETLRTNWGERRTSIQRSSLFWIGGQTVLLP